MGASLQFSIFVLEFSVGSRLLWSAANYVQFSVFSLAFSLRRKALAQFLSLQAHARMFPCLHCCKTQKEDLIEITSAITDWLNVYLQYCSEGLIPRVCAGAEAMGRL